MIVFTTRIAGRYVDVLALTLAGEPAYADVSNPNVETRASLSYTFDDIMLNALRGSAQHLVIPCDHGMACDTISHYTPRRAS